MSLKFIEVTIVKYKLLLKPYREYVIRLGVRRKLKMNKERLARINRRKSKGKKRRK